MNKRSRQVFSERIVLALGIVKYLLFFDHFLFFYNLLENYPPKAEIHQNNRLWKAPCIIDYAHFLLHKIIAIGKVNNWLLSSEKSIKVNNW